MEYGKGNSEQTGKWIVDRVWEGGTARVTHDFVIEPPDGELLDVLEIIEGWDRARIYALNESLSVNSAVMARFRVWVRKSMDREFTSVVIQVDLRENEPFGPFNERKPQRPSDSASVEIAGMSLDL